MLQEFNLQIQDKKGVENVVANHLSRLVIAHDSHGLPINDELLEESLMLIEVAPWYSHIANYLVTRKVPSEWRNQDKRHFFAKIHAYYWEEPFLFKYCRSVYIIFRYSHLFDSFVVLARTVFRFSHGFCLFPILARIDRKSVV